jgi:hypothetical protein
MNSKIGFRSSAQNRKAFQSQSISLLGPICVYHRLTATAIIYCFGVAMHHLMTCLLQP